MWIADYEADESEDLKEFLNYSDFSYAVIEQLLSIAKERVKATYYNLLEELNIEE